MWYGRNDARARSRLLTFFTSDPNGDSFTVNFTI